VLPHVGGQNHRALVVGHVHQGIVLVRGRGDLQLAVLDDQPGPARAELAGAGSVEGLLELVQPAQVAVDGGGQLGRRLSGLVGGGQQLPEQAVVPVPAAVVAHRLRGLGDVGEQLFQ
jgi:hypothetical protein